MSAMLVAIVVFHKPYTGMVWYCSEKCVLKPYDSKNASAGI